MSNQIFYKDEATASARRVTVHLVDPLYGEPVTTETGGQPRISKNGAAPGNTSAVLVAIDTAKGDYYVELTAGELDTRGAVTIEYVNDGVVVVFEKTCSVIIDPATVATGVADIQARLPAALTAGGNMKSDALAISGDTSAADNVEAAFDGTGYVHDTAPAQMQQVRNIGQGSSAINLIAASRSIVTGTETGTLANTNANDGTYWNIADVAGTLEVTVDFTVSAIDGGVATTLSWLGYVVGAVNTIKVFARNWGGATWDQIGSIVGIAGTVESDEEFELTNAHTAAGIARIRFQATGLTAATLKTDYMLLGVTSVAPTAAAIATAVGDSVTIPECSHLLSPVMVEIGTATPIYFKVFDTAGVAKTGEAANMSGKISNAGDPAVAGAGTFAEPDAGDHPGVYTYTPGGTEFEDWSTGGVVLQVHNTDGEPEWADFSVGFQAVLPGVGIEDERSPADVIEGTADELGRRHGQGLWGASHPVTREAAEQLLNTGGTFEYGGTISARQLKYGWNFDDASGGAAAAWGGVDLNEVGTINYRQEGVLGPGDFGIGATSIGTNYLEAPTSATMDVGTNDDFLLMFAFVSQNGDFGVPDIRKENGAGGSRRGWALGYNSTRFAFSTYGPGGSGCEVQLLGGSDYHKLRQGAVFVVGRDCTSADSNKLFAAVMLRDGTYIPGTVINGEGVASLASTAKMRVSTRYGSSDANVYSHLMCSSGEGVAFQQGVASGLRTDGEAVTRAYHARVFGTETVLPAVESVSDDVATLTSTVNSIQTVVGDINFSTEEMLYGDVKWDVSVPAKIAVPTAGTRTYRIEISGLARDSGAAGSDGDMTVAVVNQAGVSRAARLDSVTMASPTYGTYRAIYTSTAGDPDEQLLFHFTGAITWFGDTRDISEWAVSVTESAPDFDLTPVTDQLDDIEDKIDLLPAADDVLDVFKAWNHDGGVSWAGLMVRLEAWLTGKRVVTGTGASTHQEYKRTDESTPAFEGDLDATTGSRAAADVAGSEPP